MPRSRSARSLTTIAAKIPNELKDALEERASRQGTTVSALVAEILADSMGARSGSSKDRGYEAGMRQAIHEARSAIAEALAEKWPGVF